MKRSSNFCKREEKRRKEKQRVSPDGEGGKRKKLAVSIQRSVEGKRRKRTFF